MTTIEKHICMIVADQICVEIDDARIMDTDYTTTGLVDSLDLVEIIIAVEEDFAIEIEDEAIDNFKTTRDLVNYVKTHVQERVVEPVL